MFKKYSNFIFKAKYPLFILLLIIFIFLVPVGWNSFNHVDPQFGFERPGRDQEVLTFTSTINDLVLVIDGDKNILSQEVWDWVADFTFDIQQNDIISDTLRSSVPIQHIFNQAKSILGPYLVSIHLVTGLLNTSSYILIEGTQQFVNNYNNFVSNNDSEPIEKAYNVTKSSIKSDALFMVGYQHLIGFTSLWLQKVADFVNSSSNSVISYSDIVTNWEKNPGDWRIDFDNERLNDGYTYLLDSINQDTKWTENFTFPTTSKFLFGTSNTTTLTFIKELFNQGKGTARPTRIANNRLIDFITQEYIPFGFSKTVRKFYLTAFTNYQKNEPVTSMIIRMPLHSNVTDQALKNALEEIDKIANNLNENNPFNYEVALFSVPNYYQERSNDLSSEMHRVDLIALIIGIILTMIWLRDLFITVLTMGIAWTTTEVTRGVIVSSQDLIGPINSTAFSFTTTILLGAAMNYSVFFVFRYLEERKEGKSNDKATEKAINHALHSVLISGTAVFLVMLPFVWSEAQLVEEFSKSLTFGLIIQLALLFVTLPVMILILAPLRKSLNEIKIPDIKFRFKIKHHHIMKILVITGIVFLISIVIISTTNPTMNVNDYISEQGQTGRAQQIFENEYPENYFSKVLLKLNHDQPLIKNESVNTTINNAIHRLSEKLYNYNTMEYLISPAWPLGKSFKFDNQSIALVEYQTSLEIAKSLTSQNSSFVIIQIRSSLDSSKTREVTGTILETIDKFEEESKLIKSITVSGLPTNVKDLHDTAIKELFILAPISFILLTSFLWLVLNSISVPIRLELSILISNIIAIALASLIWILISNQSLNLMVIIISSVLLFGLGTDFDIFLYNRIMEEKSDEQSFIDAINTAIDKSGIAIQLAGLVMALSFFSLITSSIAITRQFGIISFLAVVLDITIVRVIVAPALLLVINQRENKESDQNK